MAKTPYPYQLEAIELATKTNALLIYEAGLGKTIIGVESAFGLYRSNDRPLPVLVVTPKNSRWQWRDTILEQVPGAVTLVLDTQSDAAGLVSVIRDRRTWVVTHYAAVVRHVEVLRKLFWYAVVCDEVHRIQNREADRTRAVKAIPSLRKIGLTATIMEKSPVNLWSVLNWLYPDNYRGFFAFRNKHAIIESGYMGYPKVMPGAKDPQALADELRPFTLARSKQQVAGDMPELIEQPLLLAMSKQQENLYQRIKKSKDLLVDIPEDLLEPIVELDEEDEAAVIALRGDLLIQNALTRLSLLQRVTTDPTRVVDRAGLRSVKLDWLDEFIEDNPDLPILVFTKFRSTALSLGAKYKAVTIVGGKQAPPDLQQRRPHRIVATIEAGGEALDLPWIDTTIFVDTLWSSRAMYQARNRTHRIGIVDPKRIIYLLCEGTVDEDILDVALGKLEALEMIYKFIRQGAREDTGT